MKKKYPEKVKEWHAKHPNYIKEWREKNGYNYTVAVKLKNQLKRDKIKIKAENIIRSHRFMQILDDVASEIL